MWIALLVACGSGPLSVREAPDLVDTDVEDVEETGLLEDTDLPSVPDPITVAVISDLNGSYGSTDYGSAVHDAVDRLVTLDPDLVLVTGDMVAGQKSGLDYEAMWAGFHDAVSDPLAAADIPLAVAPGNHDASAYSGYANEREIYVEQWTGRLPDVTMVDDTDYPLKYAFTAGGGLFVALDDTTIGSLSSAQMDWLDTVLDGEFAPKVVFGHVPLYPVAINREDDVIGDADLEELLVEHDVDLFIAGHHHAYYPGRRGPLRLVTMACLGSGAREYIGTSQRSDKAFVLFEVGDGAIHDLDAFSGDRFDEVILRESLPESISWSNQITWRDDLAWER